MVYLGLWIMNNDEIKRRTSIAKICVAQFIKKIEENSICIDRKKVVTEFL